MDFPSGDVTVIQLSGSWGELTLLNIYNDCETNDMIRQVETFTQMIITLQAQTMENTKPIIWMGDFNRHHPHWDDPTDTRLFTRSAIDNTEVLIGAVAGLGLDLALPPGIPTHLHNVSKRWTRLDQVFISEDHLDAIITYDALSNTPGINTDHLLILTTLDLNLTRTHKTPPRNFCNIDWEVFKKALMKKLEKERLPSHIKTPGEVEVACIKLTKAIQETIKDEVHESKLGIKAKRWWTKELTKLRHKANRKGRKASKYKGWPDHQLHVERKQVNKTFHKTLEHTK